MKRWTQLILLFGVILGIYGIWNLRRLEWLPLSPARFEFTPSVTADVAVTGFSFRQFQDDRMQWEISAASAEIYEKDQKAGLTDLRVVTTSADGFRVTVEGEVGELDTATQDFAVRNTHRDVAVVMSNGMTLFSKDLRWVQKAGRVFGSGPVRILGNGLEIQGREWTADLSNQEVRISEGVHVVLH
jgi:LPS export ABC transporter protein LptC